MSGVWFVQLGPGVDLLFAHQPGGQHLTQVQHCELGLLAGVLNNPTVVKFPRENMTVCCGRRAGTAP